ncbi:type II secretion system F family protein [Streptosporangiaceae bacterium NEAU-GS5]|nr:type II secretion system F family protein [Streptosporangiaceae bacterium NEAU-GS5]
MTGAAIVLIAMSAWLWAGPKVPDVRVTGLFGTRSAQRPRPLATLLRRPRLARTATEWRRASIELCQAVVAELAAGRTPGAALERAVDSLVWPDPALLIPVAVAARDGGDIPAALVAAAPERGGEGLVRLAACWRVGVAAGGGLTALVERVGASLREAEAHRLDVAAQLAGPKATARLLAGLPIVGLLMGTALGMNPVTFLFGSPAGYACLILGLVLDAAGVWWTHHLVTRAERA